MDFPILDLNLGSKGWTGLDLRLGLGLVNFVFSGVSLPTRITGLRWRKPKIQRRHSVAIPLNRGKDFVFLDTHEEI